MRKDDCFNLGNITKQHGYKGDVTVHLDVDDTSKYQNLKAVFIEKGPSLIPFFIEKMEELSSGQFKVTFEGVRGAHAAEELIGANLFLPLTSLEPLSGKKFYYHEIIGFMISDKTNGEIGMIEDVIEFNVNPLAKVFQNESEILVPLTDDVIEKIDRQKKVMYVDLPEGLLDLYLNPNSDGPDNQDQ
jgi:16S rRNA processing protein RimM